MSAGFALDVSRGSRSSICAAVLVCACAMVAVPTALAHEPLRLRALLVSDAPVGDTAAPDLGLRGEARLTVHEDAARLDLVGWSLPPQARDVTLVLEGPAGAHEPVTALPLERDGDEGRVIGALIPVDPAVQQRLAAGEGRVLLHTDDRGTIAGELRAHRRRAGAEVAGPTPER